MTVIERASTDASTCQSVRRNSEASVGSSKKLKLRRNRKSCTSDGSRYKPANPTSNIHRKAYREESKIAVAQDRNHPDSFSIRLAPFIFACSRLASRISEEPGKSLRERSTRDDSRRRVATAKGMSRHCRRTVGCFSKSYCVRAPTHFTQRRFRQRILDSTPTAVPPRGLMNREVRASRNGYDGIESPTQPISTPEFGDPLFSSTRTSRLSDTLQQSPECFLGIMT